MPRYLVTWKIDIEDAESAHEAAERAVEHFMRQGSIAHVFSVMPCTDEGRPMGVATEVDLDMDYSEEEEGKEV